jgi:hypothetical protein
LVAESSDVGGSILPLSPRRITMLREPHQTDEQATEPAGTAREKEKPRRFRIVKLEERIAPGGPGANGNGSNNTCAQGFTCHKCGKR